MGRRASRAGCGWKQEPVLTVGFIRAPLKPCWTQLEKNLPRDTYLRKCRTDTPWL